LVICLFHDIRDDPLNICGQAGGKAFQFLEVTNSAHVAALGGNVVAAADNDLI